MFPPMRMLLALTLLTLAACGAKSSAKVEDTPANAMAADEVTEVADDSANGEAAGGNAVDPD